MAKGIIYVMETVVNGLIKIGKTNSNGFERRMYILERNGYCNVAGLKKRFAIEVEDYDEKERFLKEIFSKSSVAGTELFALDVALVIQLLSSFEGRQVYPEDISKADEFLKVTEERQMKVDWSLIPDGEYTLSQRVKGHGDVIAKMRVERGKFIVLKDSDCMPAKEGWIPDARKNALIKNNKLQKDIVTNSPSTAGWVVLGHANNGWRVWKDTVGRELDVYREK